MISTKANCSARDNSLSWLWRKRWPCLTYEYFGVCCRRTVPTWWKQPLPYCVPRWVPFHFWAQGLLQPWEVGSNQSKSFGLDRTSQFRISSPCVWNKSICADVGSLRSLALRQSISTPNCGVTWEPLTYCPWAILQTSRSKFWFGAGPKLKYRTTDWTTWGCVLGNANFTDSNSNFRAIICFKKDRRSISSTVMYCLLAAIFVKERENLKGSHDHPMGGGMLGNYQQNSDIVLLCIYFLSNVYN